MTDPYWRYATSDRAHSVADDAQRTSFPGYLPSDPAFSSNDLYSAGSLRAASSDYLQKDALPLRSGAYGYDDIVGIVSHAPAGLGGRAAGTNIKGYSSHLEDPTAIRQRRSTSLGTPSLPDVLPDRPNVSIKTDGSAPDESNILFVEGLPSDCSRREVAHLFRPFIGFKDIRVIHREPRRIGEKASVLCFVEFNDSKCALTALEALQGYKFDDKKPDAPVLRIQFARFPFHPYSGPDDRRLGSVH